MSEMSWPATCPFIRRLVVLLATEPTSLSSVSPDITFRLLCKLEAEAERYEASEASKRAIGQVRQWAGDSLAKGSLGSSWQSTSPTVYRTIYFSDGRAAAWTSSTSPLFAVIEAARYKMKRHGADVVAQIIENDGLGAVVWSSESGTSLT